MKYDMSVHVPQQIENLLQARASKNFDIFEDLLEGLKNILRAETKLIAGWKIDSDKRNSEKDIGEDVYISR